MIEKAKSHKEKVLSNCLIKKINSHARGREKSSKNKNEFCNPSNDKMSVLNINFYLKRQSQ